MNDFGSLALQSGQACREVAVIGDLLPAGPLWEIGTDDFWIAIVYSLAWRKVPGSPLRAHCQMIGESRGPSVATGGILGMRSALSVDPFTASAHAIDLLVAEENLRGPALRPQVAVPSKEPGQASRQRAPAPEEWIYSVDAASKYEIPRSTLHDFTRQMPKSEVQEHPANGQKLLKVSGLEKFLRLKGRLKGG